MQRRTFGRTGWRVGDGGYGMWGMGGWTGSDDEESRASLERAVQLGCTFFDTAWAYGMGHSERLLGALLKAHPDRRLYAATKIPPLNAKWPARAEYALDEVFPPDHIRRYTEKSLENLGIGTIDLFQFHVWTDAWASDARWQRANEALKREGLVRAVGISINRWEPTNAIRALRTGLIDAVQVVYNIFDQPLPNVQNMKFYEVMSQIVLTSHLVGFDLLTVNLKTWQSMSPARQQAFQAAADKAINWSAAEHLKREAELAESFRKQGFEVYAPNINAFREHAQKIYLASDQAKDWPKGMLEKINALK